MRKHIQSNLDDISFDDAMHLIRCSLMTLTCAIGAANYFDAWLASVKLRLAFDRAERLAGPTPLAVRRLNDMRSIAAPMLALAPAPSRQELRQMRTADVDRDRKTPAQMEQQWQRSVQEQLNTIMREQIRQRE